MRSMFGHPMRKPRLQIALFALLVATANGGGVEQQAEEDQAGAKALIAAIDAHQPHRLDAGDNPDPPSEAREPDQEPALLQLCFG